VVGEELDHFDLLAHGLGRLRGREHGVFGADARIGWRSIGETGDQGSGNEGETQGAHKILPKE